MESHETSYLLPFIANTTTFFNSSICISSIILQNLLHLTKLLYTTSHNNLKDKRGKKKEMKKNMLVEVEVEVEEQERQGRIEY